MIPVGVLNSPGHYLALAKNAQALARRMAATERLAKLDTLLRTIEDASSMYDSEATEK